MSDPIKVPLSTAAEEKLKHHLKNRIMAIEEGTRTLREEKLPKWRKAYEAAPREEHKSWPFPNASNLIVPIIAIHSDTLLARCMSAVLKTSPIWYCKMFGEHGEDSDELRAALEEAMQYVGIEPFELDLYRVYHEWFGETIKYGTSTVKCPWEKRMMDELIPAGDGTGKFDFIPRTEYEGPRPEKLPFENFLCPPGARTLNHADIKIHLRQMLEWELMERRFRQVYDPAKVDIVLAQPDRTSPGQNQAMREESLGARTSSGYDYKEWDLYECHLKWRTEGSKYEPKIIATYHKKSDTLVRAIYDQEPLPIFVTARLFYRDDMFYGYGFCETLWSFQEEDSEIHNQRRDNQTVANTKVWRVDPDSKLHSGYRIYPSAMLPAAKDEIEPLDHGSVSSMTIDEERLCLELAERRSGVSPPQQGMGAGTFNKKGIYSSMGTLSLMQEGNRRTDLNISDLRYSHTILGRILTMQYAYNGFGQDRLRLFGEQAKKIEEAFKAVKAGTMGIPVYSSTASINREVEKQSDIMLVNLMNQHYQMIANLLMQVNNPLIPPESKEYTSKAIKAADTLMKLVLKNFGHDEVERLVPEPTIKPTLPAAPAGGNGNGTNRPIPQAPGQVPSAPGVSGGQGVPSVPGGSPLVQ